MVVYNSSLREIHRRTMERLMPYWITHGAQKSQNLTTRHQIAVVNIASPAIWDHRVSAATGLQRWTRPALTQAREAGTRFTYPGGMKGWVDMDVSCIPRWFTCPQTVTHLSSNHLIVTRSLGEPTIFWSKIWHHIPLHYPVSWIYRVSQKARHFAFFHIFANYWPIFKIFYWHTLMKNCDNAIIISPITPKMRLYTTLWNINEICIHKGNNKQTFL